MCRGLAELAGWRRTVPGLLLAVAGCGHAAGLDRALLADRNPAAHQGDLALHYVVHFPDVLSFQVDGRRDWSGDRPMAPDGRVWFDASKSARVEGLTVPEISLAAARRLGVSPESVRVRVAGYNSQQIYLFGEVSGLQQAVAYQGPETVLELLQRVGGVTPGAAPRDVQVVRSHVADDKRPEVFQVDLAAIVLRHDQKTNIALQPFDKIYIGQTRQSKVSKCLPPWMRALYESISDMRQ
jgi:protein involved in polysaccharide export with SLBB domain